MEINICEKSFKINIFDLIKIFQRLYELDTKHIYMVIN